MKTIRNSILCLTILLVAAPMLAAQELSKYHSFSLGAKLPTVLKLTERSLVDVTPTRGARFQELTWWPPSSPGRSVSSTSVEQIVFSFYNGELYKLSVTYDQASTEGLTADDVVKSISVQYGAPTVVVPDVDASANNRYEVKERSVATWEDSQDSINLVRSAYTHRFALIMYSKRANAEAQVATVEAAKLEEQEGPQKEADRQKKEADDLDNARQKNRKTFRP
jgi:hypothetical protein